MESNLKVVERKNLREKLKLWLFLPCIQMDRDLEHMRYEEQLQDVW